MTQKRKKRTQKQSPAIRWVKNILLWVIVAIFCHIFYVNIMISINNNKVNELLVLTNIEEITSNRLSYKNIEHLEKNIEIFNQYEMRKILILTQNTGQDFSQWDLLKHYLLEKEIWWGNIIDLEAHRGDYYKEILSVLANQQLNWATIISAFWDYYDNNILFHTDSYKKISLHIYYAGWKDFCLSLFNNYYNFWRNMY